MVFRIAAIKPGVTKPPREEPQVLVLRQIAGNVARRKIDFSIQIQAEALGACINRVKDRVNLVTTRLDLFLKIVRDDRERLFKSCMSRKAVRIANEKNSNIVVTFAGGHRDESRIAVHALIHLCRVASGLRIEEVQFKDCLC
ncbi:hypothetical protein G5I_02189 [Acromyrmex echinatior]|uniref:Uncharacterized protein n=1 Tax=Acromyrmex echinatior TaxID=103372 RepID=F4W9N5_ACREC|nr:hypothetical protein G5I_02189 [Acromyrmex echinatior]